MKKTDRRKFNYRLGWNEKPMELYEEELENGATIDRRTEEMREADRLIDNDRQNKKSVMRLIECHEKHLAISFFMAASGTGLGLLALRFAPAVSSIVRTAVFGARIHLLEYPDTATSLPHTVWPYLNGQDIRPRASGA